MSIRFFGCVFPASCKERFFSKTAICHLHCVVVSTPIHKPTGLGLIPILGHYNVAFTFNNMTIFYGRSRHWRNTVTAVVPTPPASLCHYLPRDVPDGDSRPWSSSIWGPQHYCLHQSWQRPRVLPRVWTFDNCKFECDEFFKLLIVTHL